MIITAIMSCAVMAIVFSSRYFFIHFYFWFSQLLFVWPAAAFMHSFRAFSISISRYLWHENPISGRNPLQIENKQTKCGGTQNNNSNKYREYEQIRAEKHFGSA